MKKVIIVSWLEALIKVSSAFSRFLENWTQGLGFAHRNLEKVNLAGADLRGCDFQGCSLQGSDISRARGGFSWVRPCLIAFTLGFAALVACALSVQSEQSMAALREIVFLPKGAGFGFSFGLAVLIYLQIFMALIYSVKVAGESSSAADVNEFWFGVNQSLGAILALIPLGFFAVAFFAAEYAPMILQWSLSWGTIWLIGVILLGYAGYATFRRIFGRLFKFNTAFYEADLQGVSLVDANFANVGFRGANLTKANLTRANLTGADLRFANLTGAILTGTDLSNALTDGAIGLKGEYDA